MGFKTINGKPVFIPDDPNLPFEEKQKLLRTTGLSSVITEEDDKQQERFVIPELPLKSNQELKKISNDHNFSRKIQAEAIKILKERASKGQVDFNVID